MALTDLEYKALEDVVGPKYISREPAFMETYNQCWGHRGAFDQKFAPPAAAVLLPGSVEELQAIVRVCNRHNIMFKPISSGFEIVSFALANDRGILLDLKRMDRILDIDVKNQCAVVEPFVNIYRLQIEARRHGLTLGSIGAGPSGGVIAGNCCHFGAGNTNTSMGGLGRSVLGVEWVLPSGELLTMGSAEASGDWFTADGPGPSLRGVLRGRAGANGGHGIISKASVKLYPWYGPPELKFTAAPGLPVAYKRLTEVPSGYKVFMVKFATREDMFEGMRRVGRAEISQALNCALTFPFGEGNDEQYVAMMQLQEMGLDFNEVADTGILTVLGADTPRGMEYREKYLMHIVNELNGIVLPIPPSEVPLAFVAEMWHFTYVIGAFRNTSDFFISPTGDGSPDKMLVMRNRADKLIEPYMGTGVMMDFKRSMCWMAASEHAAGGFHEENCTFFDPYDPDSLQAFREVAGTAQAPDGEFIRLGLPHLGGGLQIEWLHHVHQTLGPIYDNYDVWLRKIKKMLDPNGVADWSAYIPAEYPE